MTRLAACAASFLFFASVIGVRAEPAATAAPAPEPSADTQTVAPSAEAKSAAKAAISGLAPRDVGARYGQALGALEICIGAKITEKAAALTTVYQGADFEAFNVQANKIHGAWIKVKNCVHQDDPNQCKVIMDESCTAAIAEIGPKGTAIPGLLEPPPRRQ